MTAVGFASRVEGAAIHGRDGEVQILLDVYEKSKLAHACTSNNSTAPSNATSLLELVMIGGHSGTGKTALVQTLGPIVHDDDGFFVSGKFELASTSKTSSSLQDPYAVFTSAFTQYADQLLHKTNGSAAETDSDTTISSANNKVQQQQHIIAQVRQAVHEAVGTEAKLLTDMIPSLERLIGKQEAETNIRTTKNLKRFHYVFSQFCRALSSVAPLVLFLDDLQWSDASSLDLLEALLQPENASKKPCSLVVIGSYRDDEILTSSELQSHMPKQTSIAGLLQRSRDSACVNLTEITLQDLSKEATNLLVAGFLETDHRLTIDLSHIIHDACQGNPLHAGQLLRLLVDKGHLNKGNKDRSSWTWENQTIVKTCESTETMDELLRQKVLSLPHQFTLRVLQIAACMGDDMDETAVCCVLEANISEVELAVQTALREGHLIMSEETSQYRFTHDRIRQAVLATINDRDALSFHIGQQLWRRSPPAYVCSKLYMVTNLLNFGAHQWTDPAERLKVAALNLEAGTKAACLAAFPDSSRYLAAGIELLRGAGDYWNEDYELTLNMFNTCAETELCNQDYFRVSQLADEVFLNARTVKDKLRAYASLISSMGQVGDLQDAIKLGVDLLAQLGESLPEVQSPSAIAAEIQKTKKTLRRKSSEDLLRLPPMHDEDKLAAMHIMTTLLPYCCQAGSSYTEIITRRLVWMFLKHGFHKGCALGFTKFGFYLCESDPKEGHRLGQVAISIVERSGARELAPRVKLYVYGFIHHWMYPLKQSLPYLSEVVKVGTVIGDVEYAMRALVHMSGIALHSGMSLDLVEEKVIAATQQMILYKQEVFLQMADTFLQFIHNLTGRAPDPRYLSGKVLDGSCSPQSDSIAPIVQYYHCVFGADLAFTFGDYTLASKMLEKREAVLYVPHGHYVLALELFKEVLISIARFRRGDSKRQHMKIARQGLEKMKAWAKSCPHNFLHKQILLQAELASLKPPQKSARCYAQVLYDQAIQCALKEGFVQEAALACELAGDYLLRVGDSRLGKDYGEKARHLYLEWGATEKVKQLMYRAKEK